MFTSSRELDNLLLFSAHEPQIVPLSLSHTDSSRSCRSWPDCRLILQHISSFAS